MGDQPNEEQPNLPAEPGMSGPYPGSSGGYPGAGYDPDASASYPGAYPAPYPVAYPGAPAQPRGNGARTAAAVISALAVIATGAAAVLYSTGSDSHKTTPAAFQNGAPLPTPTAAHTASTPTPSASPDPDRQTSDPSADPSGTDTSEASAFDWDSLNDNSTDPTPFTPDALLPQSFTDSQNITYKLEAAGEKKCVQSTMGQDVQHALNEYGCKEAMTGSYLVDSSVNDVSSDSDILVSVQIWPFSDTSTANAAEKALAKVSSKQFSIWCPTSGPGAAPCNSQNFYHAATWWSLQADYRYVIEATAVYTNMTQDTSVAYKWEKTAATEAIKQAGPQVYADSQ